jgi:carbon monoxide dehydrogenase subunit G
MPTVEESIFIDRPPQEVFDYVIEPANLPVWDTSIVHAELLDAGPVGAGSSMRGTSKILGRRFDWTTEVTYFEPPRRSSMRSVGGDLKFTVTFTVQPEGSGTRLTQRIDADSGLGGIFGKLADPLVEKAQARTTRASLETLAEILTEHER